MGVSDFATGIILAFLTAIAFGSQTSFVKVPAVIACKLRMEVFNIYFMIGCASVCLIGYCILVIFLNYIITFSFMGVISAFLLYFGELFVLLTIQKIGIAYGMTINVLSGTITSIIIQYYFLGQNIENIAITIIGLIVVAISVILTTLLKTILRYYNLMDYDTKEKLSLLPSQESVLNIVSETYPLIDIMNQDDDDDDNNSDNDMDTVSNKNMLFGFIYSSISGICYASLPLPSLYTDEYSSGIRFCFSFGIGCVLVLPLSFLNVFIMNKFYDESLGCLNLMKCDQSIYHFKKTFLASFASGVLWGIGNMMGICSFLYLDYVVVGVYVQFHLIVALLWGICLWREITQKIEIIFIFALTISMIGGFVLVTFGVYGSL